jgi:hypothetical protein
MGVSTPQSLPPPVVYVSSQSTWLSRKELAAQLPRCVFLALDNSRHLAPKDKYQQLKVNERLDQADLTDDAL